MFLLFAAEPKATTHISLSFANGSYSKAQRALEQGGAAAAAAPIPQEVVVPLGLDELDL